MHLPQQRPQQADRLVSRLRAVGCVFAEDEARLLTTEAVDADHLEAMVERRVAGEPLEQVLGWVDFAGLRLTMDPGVFVPRQRTVLLVREVLALLAGRHRPMVVDLGCGSGAIAACVLAARPDALAYAVDLDAQAVACARRNLPAGSPERVIHGDLYDALPPALAGGVDVIVANAPYVPSAEVDNLPREAREHEHLVALDGGPDGLDVQRRVIAGAPGWLRPAGELVVETGLPQIEATCAAMTAQGLEVRVIEDEDSGGVAVVGARRTPPVVWHRSG